MTERLGASPAEIAAVPDMRRVAFEFTGTTAEYFRIWIVNLVLTVLTLGIYSAWAKVRSNRYLYGSTWLDGRPFEYTANPVAILKGRLLAVVVLLVIFVGSDLIPPLSPLFSLLFLAFLPWIIVKALTFRAFHTRYRNLRFHFHGQVGGAWFAYLLWPAAGVLSGGLLWPLAAYKRAVFTWDNLGYGNRRFEFRGRVATVYTIYLVLLGFIVGAAALIAVFAGIVMFLAGLTGDGVTPTGDEPQTAASAVAFLVLVALYLTTLLLYLFPPAYLKARMGNYALNHLDAAGHRPESTMAALEVYWIYLSNMLAIVFSIGLAIPWATIRMARYRAAHTAVEIRGDLGDIEAGEFDRVSAAGEEFGDVFDIDIGL